MTTDLHSAMSTYLAHVKREFSEVYEIPKPKGSLHVMISDYERLRRLVDKAEASVEFSDLVTATHDKFPHKLAGIDFEAGTRRNIQSFFRLSGLYEDVFQGKTGRQDALFEHYSDSFESNRVKITYLALLEFVEFSENKLIFNDFVIRKFTRKELDELFRNSARKIFFESAWIDSAKLEDYWFVVCEELVPQCRGEEELYLSHDVWRVDLRYSPFPPLIYDALKQLALFNWGSNPMGELPISELLKDYSESDAPFRPNIPFVIRETNSLFSWGMVCPDLSLLAEEPKLYDPDAEPVYEKARGLSLNDVETERFQKRMRDAGDLFAIVNRHQRDWGFVDTALGFLVKGFLSDGLEQLLWNITAIEALLGEDPERGGLVNLLANRIKRVLGQTQKERKSISKQFKDIYDLRSQLVHGNAGLAKKTIAKGRLCEARDMARAIVLWVLNYLACVDEHLPENCSDVPNRNDLLAVLDMDIDRRRRISGVLKYVPNGFPSIDGWLPIS